MKNSQDIVYTKPVHTISSVRIATVQDGPDIVLPYISVFRSLTLHSLPVQLANLIQVCTDFSRTFTLNSHLSKQPTAIRLPFGHTTPDLRRRDTF